MVKYCQGLGEQVDEGQKAKAPKWAREEKPTTYRASVAPNRSAMTL